MRQRSESPVGGGLYGQDVTQAAYARLAQVARLGLGAGYTVIVDATFLQRWQRAQLREAASALGAPVAVLSVQAPEDVLRQRIEGRAARSNDPSEATVAVLQYQRAAAQAIAALWWIVGAALAFLTLVLYVPTLRELFKFGRLHSMDLVIAVMAGTICIAASEIVKRTLRFDKET